MKKVIKGKLYNTDTAKLLGEWSNGYSSTDFSFLAESLYLTKSGAYFLHGEGGGNTKYSQSYGNNSWGGSEQIVPISPQSAREWAEQYLTADEYSEIFGVPEEAGDTKVALNISVSLEFKNQLTKIREETGKSISQIIEDKFNE